MAEWTPKQRMLAAYRGEKSDRTPVAPEFWYYYPAKVLGLKMVEFEREAPFWQSLQKTFVKYGCEGWGAVFPEVRAEGVRTKTTFRETGNGTYLETVVKTFRGEELIQQKEFSDKEPSWLKKHWAEGKSPLAAIDMLLSSDYSVDTSAMLRAYREVGEDYLPEVWLGMPFFDFIADIMGFEDAILYFMEEEEDVLVSLRERYTEYQCALIERLCAQTPYESYVVGCGYSCNSLIGPNLWRKWDKPYLTAVAAALHKNGKLLHVHFHGKSMETVEDFAQTGIDCVCPFERAPGGDVNTEEDLTRVRAALLDRVTFNGNVHTVKTLIFGTPDQVREEVRQIKRAFAGSNRLIIGTGDQVGYETPEENILAMIDEGKK